MLPKIYHSYWRNVISSLSWIADLSILAIHFMTSFFSKCGVNVLDGSLTHVSSTSYRSAYSTPPSRWNRCPGPYFLSQKPPHLTNHTLTILPSSTWLHHQSHLCPPPHPFPPSAEATPSATPWFNHLFPPTLPLLRYFPCNHRRWITCLYTSSLTSIHTHQSFLGERGSHESLLTSPTQFGVPDLGETKCTVGDRFTEH